uniref:Uncharacterized protein n=1 Tax=Eutreptiella gymnastica TaxID=73025 RepID=A0A7S4CU92_9EUGL
MIQLHIKHLRTCSLALGSACGTSQGRFVGHTLWPQYDCTRGSGPQWSPASLRNAGTPVAHLPVVLLRSPGLGRLDWGVGLWGFGEALSLRFLADLTSALQRPAEADSSMELVAV